MKVNRFDHVVLTVASIDATVDFYTRVLGMAAVGFGAGRTALQFGTDVARCQASASVDRAWSGPAGSRKSGQRSQRHTQGSSGGGWPSR
jgi:catechol 2,3-dioxygenase-like lactoylglutathione lyase family enzyme